MEVADMSEIQSMMLSVCFGATFGYLIGNLVGIIIFAVGEFKEKRRKRQKAEDTSIKTE
jgi:biotin transporter BioY